MLLEKWTIPMKYFRLAKLQTENNDLLDVRLSIFDWIHSDSLTSEKTFLLNNDLVISEINASDNTIKSTYICFKESQND